MDDHIESEFRSEVELRGESLRLRSFVGAIHDRCLGVIRCFRLQCADACRGGEFLGWQAVVVHTGLADGGDFRVRCESADSFEPAFRFLVNEGGMQAHDRVHAVELLRQRNRSAAAFQARSDADDPLHASLVGGGDDFLDVVVKVRIIEVGVCIYEHEIIVR